MNRTFLTQEVEDHVFGLDPIQQNRALTRNFERAADIENEDVIDRTRQHDRIAAPEAHITTDVDDIYFSF